MNVAIPPNGPQWVSINQGYETLDDFMDTWATHLTTSGVYIQTREPLAVGTVVELRFPVALDQIYIIRGEGVVTRADLAQPRGIEVRFTSLTDASRQIVEHVVEELAR